MSEKTENPKQRARRVEMQLKQWQGFLENEPETAEKAIKRVLGVLMSRGIACSYDLTKFYYEMKNGVSCPSDFGVNQKTDGLMVA